MCIHFCIYGGEVGGITSAYIIAARDVTSGLKSISFRMAKNQSMHASCIAANCPYFGETVAFFLRAIPLKILLLSLSGYFYPEISPLLNPLFHVYFRVQQVGNYDILQCNLPCGSDILYTVN